MSLARRNLFPRQDPPGSEHWRGGIGSHVDPGLKGLSGRDESPDHFVPGHSPGSIVVAQEDVVNLLGATSLLPEGIGSKSGNDPRRRMK